jgi:hypothetical protein
MKQAKTGVKWSLASKLLASVVAILALVVGFLTVSSSILLKRDKVAYVFDAQATACALAGREFSAYVQASLDLVRHSLLLVDPFRVQEALPLPLPGQPAVAPNPAQAGLMPQAEAQRQVQSILDNQSVSLALVVGRYKPSTGELIPVVRALRADAMRAAGLLENDILLTSAAFKAYQDTLGTQGSAFINFSQMGKPPLLAVVLSDRKVAAGTESGLAYGIISLQSFQSGMPASVGSLAIYNGQGDVLFNSDSTLLFGGSLARGRESQQQNAAAADPIVADARAADAIAFTSSATVERTVELLGVAGVPPVVASIGPVTSASARAAGLDITVEAAEHTLDGLVAGLVAAVTAQ